MMARPSTCLWAVLTAVLLSSFFEANTIKLRYTLCDPQQRQIQKMVSYNQRIDLKRPTKTLADYNFENCSLVLESGPEPVVVTHLFNKFFMRHEPDCSSNYLCIDGVYYCGKWFNYLAMYNHILPANSSMTILYKSDWHHRNEFDVTFLTEPLAVSTVVKVPFGSGSNSSLIGYKNVTYVPGMPYTDLCAVRRTGGHTATTLPTAKPYTYSVTCTCGCYCPHADETCVYNQTLAEAIFANPTFT